MTAATILSQLQWQQHQHDVAYHSDISQLTPQRSLAHMTLHQTKYLGRLAAALHADKAHDVRKVLTDAFVITLATANILNQDLSQIAPAHLDDLGALGCVLLRTAAIDCDVYNAGQVTLHYAMICANMAKACEAFDHAEDYPSRKVLAESNVALFKLVIGLAAARNIDLPSAYQARMAEVEAKSVFNAQIEKTRSDKPSAAQDNAAPDKTQQGKTTRGTIHQHR